MRRAAIVVLALAVVPVVNAAQWTLDPLAVSEAIAIGQSRMDRERAQFHLPYRRTVARAPVDYVDVITPFRRVVLVAELRVRAGDRTFGQRQALEMIAGGPPELEIRAELTFHPQNAYVGVPEYDMVLVTSGGARHRATSVDRIPRFGPRVDDIPRLLPEAAAATLPKTRDPMLGGTAVARFDARTLNEKATYEFRIVEAGRELARVDLDLGRMR